VVVLIGTGPPELSQKRKLQFFPSILPVVVDNLSEDLRSVHFQQFAVFAL
jgi:hypothetical protein